MSSYSILIVDDEPNNFDAIEALLPNESYRLHYASSGEQAIAALDKFDPDVILLDVMMPGIDGIEVCKRIKLMSQWQAVPIIMVTALSSKEDLARCLAAGADDFLTKPVNGLELRARVNSMLRLKKQHDRLQSFTKLQRNNINSLANNLNEICLDLSVGFPQEFNTPLNTISENINRLTEDIETIKSNDALWLLKSSNNSISKLHRLTEKFWFYLQLIVDNSVPNDREISIPKLLLTEILTAQFGGLPMPQDVDYEIEDALLAVNPDRACWIFRELLEYIFDRYQSNTCLKIHGQVIDNSFHFSLAISQSNTSISAMSDLIQFNPIAAETQELGIGLKIVKKLVEIYDGIFLISGDSNASTTQETTIYITLPIAANLSISASSKSLSSTSLSISPNDG